MLTQGEDVEAHALCQAGVVDLGHRPSSRARPQDGPRLSQRRPPARRARGRRRRIRWRRSSAYVRARFVDDPHLWATALFDEVVPLGYGRSYPSFARQLRVAGLRPHCEACAGVRGPGHDRDRPSRRRGDPVGLVRATPRPVGRHRVTCCWGRCRIRAAPVGCCAESMDQAHLIEAMDGVMRRLGGTARQWRTDRLATVIVPGQRATCSRRSRRWPSTTARSWSRARRGGGTARVPWSAAVRSCVGRWWRTMTATTPEEAQVQLGPVLVDPGDARLRPPGRYAEPDALAAGERPAWPTVGELADAEPLLALPAVPFPATIEVDPHRR